MMLFILPYLEDGSQEVSVPPGPLIRVEGQPVAIRCSVSEYEGPREQDFEWKRKVAGRASINVVSTFDSRYTDASLSVRVAAGDVAVARLGDSEVELRIGEARAADGGVYSCHTPSTDSVIRGSYQADVELTVNPGDAGCNRPKTHLVYGH
ncbi:unnamed protein product [Boreogadus saida]